MNPDLLKCVVVRDTAKQLYCAELGTLYRALSADATTAFGLSPTLTIHDEAGQIKGPRSYLYEALETATAAQEEPLSIIISTQAPTDADLLSVLIDDAKSGADNRTVLRMQSAPMDDDPFSEETVRAANPAFDLFMNKAEVMAMAEDARRMPSREPEFRNLVLNQRCEIFAPFISKSVWDSCGGEVVEDFVGHDVYMGLDLSAVNDLTALVAIAEVERVWHVKPFFWLPSGGLRERAAHDRVPYDVWASGGFLETTPGKSIEYEFVAERLRELFDRWTVRKVAFDRWGWRHLRPWLAKAGFSEDELDTSFLEFGQGYQSMSPALRALESLFLQGKLAHGGHPVLTMCAANAVIKPDPAGGRKLDKVKSRGRIDGMVALAMAGAAAEVHEEAQDSYLMSADLVIV